MDLERLGKDVESLLQEILGYLNFSSGAPDPTFLRNLDQLFQRIDSARDADRSQGDIEPSWRVLGQVLRDGLKSLCGRSDTFRSVEQAKAVLHVVFDVFPSAYREHHRDLLFHQTDELLWNSFFLGRTCEAVLAEGGLSDPAEDVARRAIKRLNDFLGYRPVAVLQTERKIEPYDNEWIRPIPLYVATAGFATGPYCEVLEKTLDILRATDPVLLRQAWFDLELLDELSLDPRALDFEHPVNRRPNYHFGGWDPHLIDNQGHYRRFVLQQVTLDALMARLEDRNDRPREEVLDEASAVLAGTVLMGSGVTGNGPDSHDSNMTLAKLMPHIATYRDTFYTQLLKQIKQPHAKRLRQEATRLHQPFGGARQDLNQKLARLRARQLQHVHLARLFAGMGYTEAATRQAQIVPVASARMRCEIECRLSTAHLSIDRGHPDEGTSLMTEIEDLLHRAIQCGAFVDPWNVLGFGAQFSLFPAVENSVHDHRTDELIGLVREIFDLYARLLKESAALGRSDLEMRLSDGLDQLATWWDRYATTEVGDVEHVSGRQKWESARDVAEALRAWNEAGTSAGDVRFWQPHVDRFGSPRAFVLIVETLLDHGDAIASMALLTAWIGRADEIALADGDDSFYQLAMRWMDDLWRTNDSNARASRRSTVPIEERWSMGRKFLDYLEANAEDYWEVPRLELGGVPTANIEEIAELEDEQDEDAETLFGAAYEDVTYRDSTDDGFDADMLESGTPAIDFELNLEADRIANRLAFLGTMAQLWKRMAIEASGPDVDPADNRLALENWRHQSDANRRELLQLLGTVYRYRIPTPRGTHEAMVEYARRQSVKEALLDRIVATCVETSDAARFLWATLGSLEPDEDWDAWELPVGRVFRAISQGDVDKVSALWLEMLNTLAKQPLLYVPVSRGGNPSRVVASRCVQRVLVRLLILAPRLGLLTETYDLLTMIHDMERDHPVGPGGLTEFDRLFGVGCQGIIRCILDSSEDWGRGKSFHEQAEIRLIECMEHAIEPLLVRWLEHSQNIRISVLEMVDDPRRWKGLKEFIKRYGGDLFTQHFLNYSNLRAILHQGVDAFLDSLIDDPGEYRDLLLLDELNGRLDRQMAVQYLELILEAIVENYSEYIDYNSTTTQSDQGELLYTLLDFMRLAASYDRVAWNLKPVVLAHDVLVRNGRSEAATLWAEAVAHRSAPVVDSHLQRLKKLTREYGMRLSSLTDRVNERFVRPMAIDRLCAKVRPAIEELRDGCPPTSFAQLEEELSAFTEVPSGVGFELPAWLEALEQEIEQVRFRSFLDEEFGVPMFHLSQRRLSLREIYRQIDEWGEEL